MYDIRWQRIWFVIVTLLGVMTIPLFLIFKSRPEDITLSFVDTPCILNRYLHLYCPGCGGTRALRYLVEGRIVDSFLANPMVLYAGLIYFRVWTALFYNCKKGYKCGKMIPPFSEREIWITFAIVMAYGIVRDVLLVVFGMDFLGDLAAYW